MAKTNSAKTKRIRFLYLLLINKLTIPIVNNDTYMCLREQ